MFQATRRRLALWYTTVTAILLLLFASGFYFYVRSTLIERIDDTLNHVVEVVERLLVITPVNPPQLGSGLRVNVEASFHNNPDTLELEDDHIDLEWFSANGELLWSTLMEPLDIPLHPDISGETVPMLKNSDNALPSAAFLLRQVTQRVQRGRQVLGYLRVSHPWFEVTKPTRQLFFDLSLGTGLMVIAVAAIGWFLSGLAMEPIRESYQRLKQFTADASHELRNPIAMIQTNVQVALLDPNPDPQVQHQLQVVERLTRRLGRLVDSLLFLARQDSGAVQPRFTPVNLLDLLTDVMEEQQAIATTKKLTLTLNNLLPTNQPPALEASPILCYILLGDRDQLARLFTNLVGNAIQYTPAGGQIQVELQRVGRNHAPQYQIKVQDTGIGIPETALPHLFDRFYRVDPARTHTQEDSTTTGSGLGLAIVQVIVENHQGQITVESQLNQSTTFTVLLPCSKQEHSGS